jgi:hypothetical protein
MKMTRLVLAMGLALALTPLRSQAGVWAHGHYGYAYGHGYRHGYSHGCGYGVGLPLLTFGLGLGLGSIFSEPAPDYTVRYVYPETYVYAPPARVAAPVPAPQPALPVVTPPWTPSSPGTGRWVPEPRPYSYTPTAAPAAEVKVTRKPVSASTDTARSPGNVQVYLNQ